MDAVPIVAWQQAVIVVLFALFVGLLLNWFGKQSDKWQKFMFDIDDKWRQFNKEQREENNSCMADVNAGLTNLTKVTEGLVMEVREMRADSRQFTEDLANHDKQAKEILTLVQKPSRSRAKQE